MLPSHVHLIFHKNNLRQETSPIWQKGNAPIADHVQSCTSEFSLSKSGAMLDKKHSQMVYGFNVPTVSSLFLWYM